MWDKLTSSSLGLMVCLHTTQSVSKRTWYLSLLGTWFDWSSNHAEVAGDNTNFPNNDSTATTIVHCGYVRYTWRSVLYSPPRATNQVHIVNNRRIPCDTHINATRSPGHGRDMEAQARKEASKKASKPARKRRRGEQGEQGQHGQQASKASKQGKHGKQDNQGKASNASKVRQARVNKSSMASYARQARASKDKQGKHDKRCNGREHHGVGESPWTPPRTGLAPLPRANNPPLQCDGGGTKALRMHHAPTRMQNVEVGPPGSVDGVPVEALRQGIPR